MAYKKAFTIVELLVVIVVLGILIAVVLISLNSNEIFASARDSKRLTEIGDLKRAIDMFQVEKIDGNLLGSSQTIYISIPDSSSTCVNITSLPALPTGWTYHCATTTNLAKTDGTGWMPIDFSSLTNPPIYKLPVDPQNDAISGRYYTYAADSTSGRYELTGLLEAQKEYTASVNDGGSLPGVYQTGSGIGITPTTRDKGLVGYWKFDEGSGTSTNDSSGKNITGTFYNGITWTADKTGSPNKAVLLDGVDDYIQFNDGSSATHLYNLTGATYCQYIYPKALTSSASNVQRFLEKRDWTISSSLNTTGTISTVFWWNNSPIQNDTVSGTHKLGYYLSGTDQWTASELNNWYYVCTVYDGSANAGRLYVNGILDKESNFANRAGRNLGGYSSSVSTQIGRYRYDTNYFYNGAIDDVRVYNRALSATEIKAIYDATK